MKKPNTLFTAALLVAGGGFTAAALQASAAEFGGRAALQETATDTFESLAADYEKAEADFKKKLSEADKATRKELRKNKPIDAFWPRFEAMAQGGEGRALVWLADNIKSNKNIRSKERGAALKPIYTALAQDHVNADWFEGALQSFARDGKTLGMDETMAMIDMMSEGAKSADRKAGVMFHGAKAIQKEMPEKAKEMLTKIQEDFADTSYAKKAKAAMITPADTEVGKIAPDFDGKSIDNFEFTLEDYRGKVVVLDFYGFW